MEWPLGMGRVVSIFKLAMVVVDGVLVGVRDDAGVRCA